MRSWGTAARWWCPARRICHGYRWVALWPVDRPARGEPVVGGRSSVVVGVLPPQHGGGTCGQSHQGDAGDADWAGGGLVGTGDTGQQ